MSAKRPSSVRAKAAVFAALGDETRLMLLTKLSAGRRYSIAELTEVEQGSRARR
jgi:DNA-binding transcriptional ArsR family regulator